MKSERKTSNLRRQVLEIEVKEGKLRHRKEQILRELLLMEESVDAKEDVQHSCGVPSWDRDIEDFGRNVDVLGSDDVDNDSWAQVMAYCVTNDWDIEVETLARLAKALDNVSLHEVISRLADEAPDKLKLRPPKGKVFAKDSFVFNHPKILVLR